MLNGSSYMAVRVAYEEKGVCRKCEFCSEAITKNPCEAAPNCSDINLGVSAYFIELKNPIDIVTVSGISFQFYPVNMGGVLPSQIASRWIAFQGKHVAGTTLTELQQDKLQAFMRDNNTECLTDGNFYYTLAGGMLAYCDPSATRYW